MHRNTNINIGITIHIIIITRMYIDMGMTHKSWTET